MVDEESPTRKGSRTNTVPANNEVVVITITKELLECWKVPNHIPEESLPMEVMGVVEALIPTPFKVEVLLHEEVLSKRGMVYVAARAVRRACTVRSWSHPGSIQALDLCDRVAAGEAVSEEELEKAARAATEATPTAPLASWAAARMAWGVRRAWKTTKDAASDAVFPSRVQEAAWVAANTAANREEERKFQLDDCRVCLIRENSQERVSVPTRYQRIMRSL